MAWSGPESPRQQSGTWVIGLDYSWSAQDLGTRGRFTLPQGDHQLVLGLLEDISGCSCVADDSLESQ